MEKLMKLFKEYANKKQSLVFDISWDKINDWSIYIEHRDSQTVIFDENYASIEYASARAFEKLVEWGQEFEDLEDILYNIF